MKNISWCLCLEVKVNFHPLINYAAHFAVAASIPLVLWSCVQASLIPDLPLLLAANNADNVSTVSAVSAAWQYKSNKQKQREQCNGNVANGSNHVLDKQTL